MPHDSSLKGYWDHANFRLVDTLNAEMWTRSPQLQREIQSPHDLIGTGKVGPQQAMLEPDAALAITTDTVLPWVPDIVGKDADGDRAVIIFGAAYAGFIREYSSRRACLGLSDYAKAATNDNEANWTVFQRLFLNNVVARDAVSDGDYYGKLESLLISAGISANRIILSDLCPNSIVKRGPAHNNRRQDDSKQPSKDRAPIFCKYVEYPIVAGWTWRRITESRAECIIALGHIAEHGLLRLFRSHDAKIHCNGQQWMQPSQNVNAPVSDWVDNYADPGRKLGYWLTPGRWWTISIQGRDVRLLPVYHPAAVDNWDRDYTRTVKALAVLLSR